MNPQVVLATLIGILLLACSTTASPAEGVFFRKWGTYGSGGGEFNFPEGVVVAADGSVYVIDTDNQRIQKFTSEGVLVSKWGSEGWNDGQFYVPVSVAVAYDSSVYLAERGSHRIQKFTSEGVFVTTGAGMARTTGSFLARVASR